MNDFKELCISLRKKDLTLGEIVKVTSRPKTSVYFHIRNISLSAKKICVIREASRARAISTAATRRGKSLRTFTQIKTWSPSTVLLVSHLLFDGGIYPRRGCVYNNRNKALIQQVSDAMKCIYKFEPTQYKNQDTGVLRISYFNVALGAHIKTQARKLLANISVLPIHLQRIFVRSFFDDEGSADFRPKQGKRRVRGYQKDVKILLLIQKLLHNMRITSTIESPNEVVISGKENLIRFQKQINFSKGVCINGRRSNSIWKQNLEKREILKRAIRSFKP